MPPEEEAGTPAQEAGGEVQELSAEEKDFRDFAGVEHTEKPDPSWDNKRFRTIYRKHKDAERDNEQFRSDIRLMSEHNRKLAEAAERITTSTEKLVQTEADKRTETAQGEIEKMETSLRDLKAERKAARTESDWDKVDTLDEQIQRLDRKIDKKRDAVEAAEKADKEKPKETKPEERPDTAAIREFVQGTSWYNMESEDFDPVMVSAAKEYDTALMMKPKYKGKIELTGERLEEVKKYIEKRFGWKKGEGGNGGSPPRRSKVEGVDNETEPETHEKATTLTADQKRIAHRMLDDTVGPAKAEAEYLKQLKTIEGRA